MKRRNPEKPLPQPGERKRSNHQAIRKRYRPRSLHVSPLWPILFLFYIHTTCQAQAPSAGNERAHRLILSLQLDAARTSLSRTEDPEGMRLAALANTIEVLLAGSEAHLESYVENCERSINLLKETQASSAEQLFALADIRLQMGFVYLRFNQSLAAAWSVRQSYSIARECKHQFPLFVPIAKTSGMLEVILGSVPEKYQWVLALLDMRASVDAGLQELRSLSRHQSPLGLETRLLYDLILGFVLQQGDAAVTDLDSLVDRYPANRLLYLLGATLAIKNSKGEHALSLLNTLDQLPGEPIVYTHYLKGEAYLYKGYYPHAIENFEHFVAHSNGESHRKDALYKAGLCHWLLGDSLKALDLFNKARATGTTVAEADGYAATQLEREPFPNVKLTKARFFTDGGYYKEAEQVFLSITDGDLHTRKDQVEFYYRKARWAHKAGLIPSAKLFYRQTIGMTGTEPWYFGPNACLQMGYLLRDEQRFDEAKAYFEAALQYGRYPYRNSIQSKARSALNELEEN